MGSEADEIASSLALLAKTTDVHIGYNSTIISGDSPDRNDRILLTSCARQGTTPACTADVDKPVNRTAICFTGSLDQRCSFRHEIQRELDST